MCDLFTDCNQRLCDKLDNIAKKGEVRVCVSNDGAMVANDHGALV